MANLEKITKMAKSMATSVAAVGAVITPAPPKREYIYDATIIRVKDGDTVLARIDLGFDKLGFELVLRLARINAPEMNSPDPEMRAKAVKATNKLKRLLTNKNVLIRSYKPLKTDIYHRWLADIYNVDGKCVNDELLRLKYVESYK